MGFSNPQRGFYRPTTAGGGGGGGSTSIINAPVTGTGVDNDPTLAANSATLLATQQATKSYVDTIATGLDPKQAVRLATAAALPAVTYANGSSGVGATLTADAVGALTVDGVAVALNDRILVQNQVAGLQNGIYTVTTLGTGGVQFVLTRSTDANSPSEIEGAYVFVTAGTVNVASAFVCTTAPPITIGTTAITFTQFAGSIPSTVALLAGRAGGQTLNGGTASGENLTLVSTANATKGKVIVGTALTVDEVNGLVGIAQSTPIAKLDIAGDKSFASWTTTGRMLAVEANTLTDTTGSGTIAFRAVSSVAVPTLAASSSETLTLASTLYIAGAPIAGTNVTQTSQTALLIDTGADAAKGLIIRGNSASQVTWQEWQTSAGVIAASLKNPATGAILQLGTTANTGLGLGGGNQGQVSIYANTIEIFRTNGTQGIIVAPIQPINWGSTFGALDVGLARNAAGVLRLTNGSTGTGTLYVGNVGIGISAPVQSLHIFDGHLRMDQVAPAGAPTVATGAAGVLTGSYLYMVTFVTATGETSAGTVSATVNPSAQQVALTAIPTSADATVTSRKIYRTTSGGSASVMKLVTTIADNTTTTFNDNVADGSLTTSAPYKNTTGGEIFVGTNRVMFADATFTGLGVGAGNGTAAGGQTSVAIGASSLTNITTGNGNTGVGYQSLQRITAGQNNTGFGLNTGSNNQSGSNNTFVGSSAGAGSGSNSNSNNTGVGFSAGTALTTGGNNVLIGYSAGNNLSTGASNLIVGYNIQVASGSTSNFMSIGNLLFSAGIDGTGTTLSTGNLGIGVVAPVTKLHTVLTDSGTNAVVNVATIAHRSSGTPATGFGTGLLFTGDSSTNTDQSMGRIRTEWTTATDASRASNLILSTRLIGSEVDVMTLDSAGRVYIGSTGSTSFRFQVVGAQNNNDIVSVNSTTAGKMLVSINDTYGQIGTQSNHPYVFLVNNTERARLLTSGYLGVGTGAAAAVLNIAGNFSDTSWTTTGKQFATNAATFTDTSGSGTIAFRAISSFGVPTLVASSSETLTLSANVYIAGAPVASTNVTQTLATGLMIDAGAAGSIPLVLRGASSQTAAHLLIRNSANTSIFAIDASGNVSLFGSNNNASLSATTFNMNAAGASVTVQNNTATAASPLLLKSGSNADVGSYVGLWAGGAEQVKITNAAVTITGGIAMAFSTSAAAAGLIRLPNGASNNISFRNAANSGDVVAMYLDTSNQVNINSTNHIFSTTAYIPADGVNFQFGTTTGTKIGTATSQKIGFWNATPITQPASAAQAAVPTDAATLAAYGYTQAQADAIVTLLNEIRNVLVTEGLMKGSS